VKTTAKELLSAIKEYVAVLEEEKWMLRNYPAGTCNAEDAWEDFGNRQEKSETNLQRLSKCKI
jgi:hypothetical protein